MLDERWGILKWIKESNFQKQPCNNPSKKLIPEFKKKKTLEKNQQVPEENFQPGCKFTFVIFGLKISNNNQMDMSCVREEKITFFLLLTKYAMFAILFICYFKLFIVNLYREDFWQGLQ